MSAPAVEETRRPAVPDNPIDDSARQVLDKIDPSKLQPSDYMFGKCLGEGAYARVVHAKFKRNNHEFAIKIMEKRHIKKENKIKYVMMEKTILAKLNSPMIIRLYYTFQDQSYLYMCMEMAHGGELLGLIDRYKEENEAKGIQRAACSLPMSRFYAAEIMEAMKYLHDRNIIHRDVKPENILLSATGHIKITDFGTALLSTSADETSRNSFVGTAEYVSPEVGLLILSPLCIEEWPDIVHLPFAGASERRRFSGMRFVGCWLCCVSDVDWRLSFQNPFRVSHI